MTRTAPESLSAPIPRRWRQDPLAFLEREILLEDGTPHGRRMDDWQLDDFRALLDPRHRNAYLERPRGHSKTGDIASLAVVERLAGPKDGALFCVAADSDQARLLYDDVAGKLRRNPHLAERAVITADRITIPATGSTLRVLASDAPTAYGLRPSWIACDEICEWRGRALWDALYTASGKRACRVLVATTAGWDTTSIAHEVRGIAQREDDWYFSSRGQCASWIAPAWLAAQERSLPRHVYQRLHLGLWVEGAGAYLTVAEVDAIFVDELPEAA